MTQGGTILLAAALAAASIFPCAAVGPLITRETTIWIDEREPLPLQKAAKDLAWDFKKVFGAEPRMVSRPGNAGASTICVSLNYNLPPAVARPGTPESLRIAAIRDPWKDQPVRSAVILTGSDTRGAIYAVYEFSQRFLGVDPLYFWTDHEPGRRDRIRIPEGTNISSGPPAFRYRGWFINDEDLLSGWKPGTADGTGISLAVWDKIFETLLRLKGNLIVPGTFIFPDELQVRAAADRGLVITQHHIEVLGTNTYRWPEDQPYSFTSRPGLLLSAWRHAIKQYLPGQEVIWTLGYRGRHDRPFWADDKSVGATDQDRARVIRRAIDAQIEIVRAERRDPYFLMNAWDEAVPLVEKGHLAIPDGVTLVWPDNGHGVIRDRGAIRKGQGVYYHTAMHNFMANQLMEMVPLSRIQRELGRAARAGATEYLLVNVSDIRPVVMTTKAVMELAWNATPWMPQDAAESEAYLTRWSREQFGSKAAGTVRSYYSAFFDAPARYGEGEADTMADSAYHTLARHILTKLLTGKTEAPVRSMAAGDYDQFAAFLVRVTSEAEPRWAKARTLAQRAQVLAPPDRSGFFQSHVLTQLDVNEFGNRMLKRLAQTFRESSPAARKQRVAEAIEDIERVLGAFGASEYGHWAGFYRGEMFTNVRLTHAMAKAYAGVLDGKPVPAGLPIQARTPDPYPVLKAYQGSRRVAF